MSKNLAMLRKVGGLGLAGIMAMGAGQAAAVDFNASADVQNTLAVTEVQPMSFGILFAAEANASAISSINLSANGDIAVGTPLQVAASDTTDAPSFLTLGTGQAARGLVSTGNPFTLTLPSVQQSELVETNTFQDDVAPPLTVNTDPDEAAFYLTDFVLGDFVGGDLADDQSTVDASAGEFRIEPGFNATEVEFGIGATINTDGSGSPRTSYQAATYSGTFTVEASF